MSTKLIWKRISGRDIHSDMVKISQILQWVIRSQAPKSVMLGYGEGSTTKC